jgi:hypothetical protein
MQTMEAAGVKPVVDSSFAQAQSEQLRPRHNTMLHAREPRDPSIQAFPLSAKPSRPSVCVG